MVELIRDMRLEEVCSNNSFISSANVAYEKEDKRKDHTYELYGVRECMGSRFGEYLHIYTLIFQKIQKTGHVGSADRQPYNPAAQDWLPTEAKQG